MGEKGRQMGPDAAGSAEALVDRLAGLGDVTSRKMFGGFGVFAEGAMFALVDPEGGSFLKIPPGDDDRFAHRHGRMPYGQIPDGVLSDPSELESWAEASLEAAIAAKK